MELFWEKGFHGTSVSDLVKHLGINRASLYDTYGDKYELFMESLSSYKETGLKNISDSLESKVNAFEFIKAMLEGKVLESLNDPDQRGCFLANSTVDMAPHDEKVCELLKDNMDQFVGNFEPFFIEAQKKGEISKRQSARSLAVFLYNTLNGLLVISRGNVNPKDLKSIVKTALEVFKA